MSTHNMFLWRNKKDSIFWIKKSALSVAMHLPVAQSIEHSPSDQKVVG